MPVPTVITDLSTTAASNSPAGSDAVFPNLDDYLRAHAAFIAQLNATDATKVAKAGDTMTGALTLNANASNALHAVPKQQLDAAVSPLAPKADPAFTGAAKFADGTDSAPSITFSSDTDTGLYRSGTNTLDMVTGGATRWRVDSSGRLRNTSNTQPGFAATRSANQTSGTTIICDSEARDIGSAYDNSTGVFTAPVDGAYLLAFSVSVYNQTGSAASVQTSMTGGGATIVSSDTAANTSRCSMSGTAVVYLSSGSTVSLTITSLSANLYVLPGSSFSGVLLG